MNPLPQVGVVVPAFNAANFLERAIDSIFATGYQELNAIIVDDGSADATFEVAARLCRKYHPRCQVLRHPDGKNHGVSASRNLAILESSAEWIAFLDADDVYLPNRFEHLSRLVESRGADAGIDAIDAYYEMAEICVDDQLERDANWDPGLESRFGIREAITGHELLVRLLASDTWAISAFTVRRSALISVGLYEPMLSVGEDCNLWIRLAATFRIGAGDLKRPVSLYVRHGRNAFSFSIENRVEFLSAAMDARKKLVRRSVDSQTLKVIDSGIRRYSIRVLLAAREKRLSRIAWKILRKAAAQGCLHLVASSLMAKTLISDTFPRW